MREAREKWNAEAGFTLIELMVVVLIIGILAAIAVPSFLGARKQAQDTAAMATLHNAYTTAKIYASSNAGSYTDFASSASTLEPSLPWADPERPIAILADGDTLTLLLTSESGNPCELTEIEGVLTVDACADGSAEPGPDPEPAP